ncbi:ubiquitin-specific protease 26 [Wolffia australiana]
MSRQNSRTKKKLRADETDNKLEILRRIHHTGVVTREDVCHLFSIDKPPCQGCRMNSRESPNCFCGLIPSSSGSKKSGLWQKTSDLVSSILGPDPREDQRCPTEQPAGLTNVGATCYANSILQCLYMNLAFRTGIFSIEPDLLKQHRVLDQLAHLFAQLLSSQRAVIDSLPFVKTLELDKGSQQDSHEFLTLFLSLLERSLSHSKVPLVNTLIQDIFRGSVSHVTRCSDCGKDSEASSKIDDFYGLELYIKGLDSLDISLDNYLSVEQLSGENQYFCQSCEKRVDATRNIKLRALPAVLIFQLKRYDFLMEMTKKKKITSSFSFPCQLNMGARLDSADGPDLLYDLSAVLIHKGSAATSGHYVARIRDEKSGVWWEFDDETVSQLGHRPFGDTQPNSPAASQSTSLSDEVPSTSNGAKNQPSGYGGSELFSTTDAYMLIYSRFRDQKMSIFDEASSLPAHLSEEIAELNAPFVSSCLEYQSKKDMLTTHIAERRKEVKEILSEACVCSVEDPFFWVSVDWLRQWVDNVDLPWAGKSNLQRLDNSAIQCPHGKVSDDKVGSMKRVSALSWSRIISKYGGGSTLNGDDFCIECLKKEALSFVCAHDYRDRRDAMKQFATAALAGNCADGKSYYVSRTWLVHWLRRKNIESPCEADAGPTAALRCPHGNLLPEKAPGAKRVHIPESLWLFIVESASAVKTDDSLGCHAFPSDSQACEDCFKQFSEVASLACNLRESKLIQQQNHEKLFSGKSISFCPGEKYFLLPSSWLMSWRTYVTTTGKNGSSVEPECLDAIIDSLKCTKHGRLIEKPPALLRRRGLITQRSNADVLTLIPESDWKLFCTEWQGTEEKGISAEIILLPNKVPGPCQEIIKSDVDLNLSNDQASSEPEIMDPLLDTKPETCEDCIGERDSCELMRKLNYSDAEITVHLVRAKEVPKSLLEAPTKVFDPDRRTSKRSRRASSSGKQCNLRVSATTSVYQLKLMIWEYFGVVKENQKLHKGTMEILEDSATLADKNIFPGDVLWVTDSEIHENRDIVDELSEQKFDSNAGEEGFRGTLLMSDASFV